MKYIINIFSNLKCLVLISIGILLLLLLLNKGHWQDSRFRFDQVYPITSTIDGESERNIIDYSNKTAGTCDRKGCELIIGFEKQNIEKIFLSFNYNESPDGLEIYGIDNGHSTLLDSFDKSQNLKDLSEYNPAFKYNEHDFGVKPYHASYVSGIFDSIKIKILPTKEERNISINDVFFYQKQPVSPQKFIVNLLAVHQRSALSYLFYAVLFCTVIYSVGFFAIEKFFKNKFSRGESAFIAFGISLIFWGCLGLVVSSTGSKFGFGLSLIAILLSFVYFIKSKYLSEIKINSSIVKITFCFLAFVLLYVFLFDGGQKFNALFYRNDVYFDNRQYYDIRPGSYSSDQIVPYGSVKILLYGLQKESKEYSDLVGINILSERTQLFSYAAVPFLKVFGDRLIIFEMLGIVCVLLLPLSVFLLAWEMTKDRRATYLAVFFVFTSPYLIYMYNITQLKVICTVLITAYFYFLFKYRKDNKKIYIIAGSFLAAVSILIHNFTLIYVIAGIVYLSPNVFAWLKKEGVVDILILLFPLAIFILWFIYSYLDSKSSLAAGVVRPQNILAGLDFLRQKFGERSESILPLYNRYLNFLGFFVTDPAPVLAYRSEGYFRSTIYSLTSFVLFPFFLLSLIKYFREYKAIWLYLLVLLILTLSSVGDYTYAFGMHLYLVATIPLLLVIIARVVNSLKFKYLIGICFLVLAESIFINFIVYDNFGEAQLFISQFPLYTFLIFLLFVLLQSAPLFIFKGTEEDEIAE